MSDKDIKMSCGVLASDIIKRIDKHDELILELLQERCEGFTLIQIANRLKRLRTDVKHSIHRLKLGGHVKDGPWYGRVCLVRFDFRKRVYAAHPEDAITKIDDLEETIRQQQGVIDAVKDYLTACDNYDSLVSANSQEFKDYTAKRVVDSRKELNNLLSKLKGGEE